MGGALSTPSDHPPLTQPPAPAAGSTARPQSIPGTLFVEAQGVFGAPAVPQGTFGRPVGPPSSSPSGINFAAHAASLESPKASSPGWGHPPRPPTPPLDLLLTAAALAKKYQV